MLDSICAAGFNRRLLSILKNKYRNVTDFSLMNNKIQKDIFSEKTSDIASSDDTTTLGLEFDKILEKFWY